MQITLEVKEGIHFKSIDPCYEGGFTQLTECEDCKAIQDYWSNTSRICRSCGGKLKENGLVGKWDNTLNKWVCRKY